MSWFSRSIAGTLNLGDDTDTDTDTDKHLQQVDSSSPPSSPGRGVKKDLSELTKTLSRQFWGVASFLAPPPPPEHSQISQSKSHDVSDPEFTGIRGDLAEIGGRFRSGISKLSTNIAVSEISKIASNFLQLGSEDHDYDSVRGAVGVTDEVVAFVRDIAMHPETWLDFPLPEPDDEDHQDFDMSDAQQEHALAVERLAPRLAALRIELCPGYMSEDCFWKIYFVLLHPRLSRQDAELLSTPQIVKARSSLTLELQNRNKVKPAENWSQEGPSYSKDVTTFPHEEGLSVPSIPQSESIPLETSASKSDRSAVAADYETDKHPVVSTEIQIIDKSVIKEGLVNMSKDQNFHPGSSKFSEVKDEDDGDDWLKEENSEIVGASGTTISMENEEDVSFSDLEEDDGDIPTSYKKETYSSDSSAKDSRDWVQLSRSSPDSAKDINSVTIERVGSEKVSAHSTETKESNDWLDLEDIDVA